MPNLDDEFMHKSVIDDKSAAPFYAVIRKKTEVLNNTPMEELKDPNDVDKYGRTKFDITKDPIKLSYRFITGFVSKNE